MVNDSWSPHFSLVGFLWLLPALNFGIGVLQPKSSQPAQPNTFMSSQHASMPRFFTDSPNASANIPRPYTPNPSPNASANIPRPFASKPSPNASANIPRPYTPNPSPNPFAAIRKSGAEFKPLFNGVDLTGWKHVGKGSMSVEHGLIRGHGGLGLLYFTGQKFGNCTIRVVYRMEKFNSNSGVFIRIPIEPKEEWMPVYYGYEVQIDNHPETSHENDYHITGTLYSLTKPLAKPGKPGPQWNTMEITLDGPHTIVFVNQVKVTDYTEGDPTPDRKFDFEPYKGLRPNEGYIGLQNHGDQDVVFFKEVGVKFN